jgi:broad specificity phosphatase PhoE
MTDIYFIRHGQASFGTSDYDRLSELGIHQVQILVDYLVDVEAYFPKIYSGSKRRQIDTAKKILSRFEAEEVHSDFFIMPELDEFDVAGLLATHKDEIINRDSSLADELAQSVVRYDMFQKVFVKLLLASLSEYCTGDATENFRTFKARVASGIRKIIDDSRNYKKVAVVTSGGVLAVIMQIIYGLTDGEAIGWVWRFYNASISICHVNQHLLELKLENSVVHLAQTGDTTLLTWV